MYYIIIIILHIYSSFLELWLYFFLLVGWEIFLYYFSPLQSLRGKISHIIIPFFCEALAELSERDKNPKGNKESWKSREMS